MSKLKVTLTGFMLLFVLLFAWTYADSRNPGAKSNSDGDAPSGMLEKMIVASGSATMNLDPNRLNGNAPGSSQLRFVVAPNSFFTILVFNNLLRSPTQGSMELIPQNRATLPVPLAASLDHLMIAKLPSSEQFDLVVRDKRSGFVFFNVEGHHYDYDANARSLAIQSGRLLISKDFANALGRTSDAGLVAGSISLGATMEPIEITQVVNGKRKSVVMPPLSQRAGPGTPTLVPGPDIIVGDLPNMLQLGTNNTGTQVGLGVATTSCNNGDQPVNFYALPQTDHPLVPMNLYRMSGGADNLERFEQIGQSWIKHTFGADEDDACNLGCNTSNCTVFSQLCPGCSDPYLADENGQYDLLGSRAWANPFTGAFPGGSNPGPTNHTGHVHDGVSHRIRVNVDDLNTTLNTGATYFVEAQYADPLEYTWCQAHPGQCNMYNNASYRKYLVSGTTNFTFSPLDATVRMKPAIEAWAGAGATVNQVEPDPGNDGIWLMGYKVSNPSAGVYHYEYALYNQNLDRAIQSFSVPLAAGVNISNIGFHAPPQEPGWANDGTLNNQGYSSAPWTVTQTADSITWNSETFAQNQNANAIRWATLYNFRFDADQPPQTTNATVGFFKTGSPMMVAIQAPAGYTPTPTPTPTATPRPTPTPRAGPSPRARPTPLPRP